MRRDNYKLLAIFSAIALTVFIFLPTHQASACNLIKDSLTSCITEGFGYIAYILLTIVGNIIGVLAQILNSVIKMPVYPDGGIAVIDSSWKVMRDFANMFFIVALIVMAFATIFDISKYTARDLFAKFLITALLINFSLVLGVLVIKGAQILTNTFLVPIGDMSARIGQTMNPSKLLPTDSEQIASIANAANAVDKTVFGTIVQLLFSVVFGFTMLFSLLVAFIFAVIRIPILWALLVVSPIAWILNVFPAGQNTFKKWWSLFIGWNMFLPIFLFFLYFGLLFLNNQPDIMAKIAAQTKDNPLLGGGFSFQLLFTYVLASVFLIGGTIVAMKTSMFSGTGVVQVAKWTRGKVADRLGLTAAGRAVKGRYEESQEKGEARTQRQAAGFRDILGGITGGRTGFREEQLAKDVETEKGKQRPFANDIDRLGDLAVSGSRQQRLAARARLIELGDKKFLTAEAINETYQMAGGDRSELANKLVTGIDYGKLVEGERKKLSTTLSNVEARKKNAMAMIEKDKLDADEIQRLAQQFTNEGEIKEFLEKGQKKNILAVVKARVAMNMDILKDTNKTVDERMQAEAENSFKKMTDDQVLEMMNDPAFGDSIKDSNIRNAMSNTIGKNPKRLANMATKSSGDTQRRLEVMAKVARRNQNRPKIQDLRKKEGSLIPSINQGRLDMDTIEKQILGLQGQVDPNNLNSTNNQKLRSVIGQLEKKRSAKEAEIKSLSDKRDKINERIDNLKKGESITPTP